MTSASPNRYWGSTASPNANRAPSTTLSRSAGSQLTHRAQGRDFRLTDVHGNVVKKILV